MLSVSVSSVFVIPDVCAPGAIGCSTPFRNTAKLEPPLKCPSANFYDALTNQFAVPRKYDCPVARYIYIDWVFVPLM